MEKQYVIAGSYSEYWSLFGNNREFVYVTSPHQLRGYRNFTVYLCGTYYANPDWPEIDMLLEEQEAKRRYT